jgi:hypothetical protein
VSGYPPGTDGDSGCGRHRLSEFPVILRESAGVPAANLEIGSRRVSKDVAIN